MARNGRQTFYHVERFWIALRSEDEHSIHPLARTGAGDGDDEQIIVKLNSIDPKYEKIVFIVQIYNGEKLQQHFGKVQNAFIRAVDGKNVEMARFDLSGGVAFNGQRSMVFAELVRESSGWKLNAIGEPSTSDSFVSHLRNYI